MVDEFGTSIMLTTPLRAGEKFSNSTVLLNPQEDAQVVYSKIHLFDVDVEGAPPVRESDHFVNGSGPALIDFRGWKIGLSICYDLRFAELYLNYAQKADVIVVPSGKVSPYILLSLFTRACVSLISLDSASGDSIANCL